MIDAVTSEILVPANHPALAGHFPGQPLVPAVVLLDAVLAEIRTHGDFVLRTIPAVKFLHPVLPDETIELRIQFTTIEAKTWRASFQGQRAADLVFEGSFVVLMGSRP
jgi:3-hydroxymyristoyl/3-hydroxydecanoyl-(acyl carrier protein) dehydratase